MFQSAKPKSAVKIALPRSKEVSLRALKALQKTAEIVGSTLGPFGQHVLIEQQQSNMKPFTTKDGVTVHKNIGYRDPVEQVVLEAARDAAVRTAQEAGDGTTTATILSYAIASKTYQLTTENKKCPPQRVVRHINSLAKDIEADLASLSRPITAENYQSQLHKVASLSANGDFEMADVIMEAYDLVGDQGNITLSEEYGLPSYKVEKFEGFTVEKGFEDSCEQFYSVFLNDPSNSRVILENPHYILFDGKLLDVNTLSSFIAIIDAEMSLPENQNAMQSKNIVVLAHEFSKQVLATLAYNFQQEGTYKVFPLLTTQTIIQNSRTQFLNDVAAFTGAVVFNPISKPIQQASFRELIKGKSKAFESTRYRSNILGNPDPTSVALRVQELEHLLKSPESVYDRLEIERRIGKLTCGVAKVKVVGPSQAEIRERKDRAEDAWCAVRSATKHGTLPGGGWALAQLSKKLEERSLSEKDKSKQLALNILSQAFLDPIRVLYSNAGFTEEEIDYQIKYMKENPDKTFDLQNHEWVDAFDILDSAPAVLEAIRNSISIASLIGTLGGVVVFDRDREADLEDAKSAAEFVSTIQEGESTATQINDADRNSY